jgi:hypothetical protein
VTTTGSVERLRMKGTERNMKAVTNVEIVTMYYILKKTSSGNDYYLLVEIATTKNPPMTTVFLEMLSSQQPS